MVSNFDTMPNCIHFLDDAFAMPVVIRCRPMSIPQLILAWWVLLTCAMAAHAQQVAAQVPDYAAHMKRIQAILEQPEDRIDLARAELSIDQLIDPSIDINATLKKLDAMATEIRRKLPPRPSSLDKVQALREYLYVKGEWNRNQPFQYDFSDPKGTRVRNKLLPNFLASRKGNCVSMPFLFIMLGQKLGIEVTAAEAPAHVFVKYRNEAGQWFNLETTSTGGPTADASYREQAPMTDEAIANGVYMRPLSKKETVTVMLGTLMQHYAEQRQYGLVVAVANLILKHHPNSVTALLSRGSMYGRLFEIGMQEFEEMRGMVPFLPEERALLQYYAKSNQADFERAEALGWRMPTPEDDQRYLQKVQERIQAEQ